MHTRILKVCGMRDAANIRQVEALGIDWMGFIFWPKSCRYVASPPAYLPTTCRRVGVFVDEQIDVVCRTASRFGLHAIQLHGSEQPEYLRALRARLSADGPRELPLIVKAFNIASAADLAPTSAYAALADYFLFDTKGKNVGGNGQQFDWAVLNHYHGPTPFLLSGGIGPSDAPRLSAFGHQQCAGFDLNSRFEVAPALKDIRKLQKFLEQLYEQD